MDTEIVARPRLVIMEVVPRRRTTTPVSVLRSSHHILGLLLFAWGLRPCDGRYRGTSFHLTIRMADGDTWYGSVRRSAYLGKLGSKDPALLAWDYLRGLGYRGFVFPCGRFSLDSQSG
jgi:hypothetical protein